MPINEMARIGKYIEVNNEDTIDSNGNSNKKFPHFHWLYNRKIHFKFANRMPKNASELRKMIAFDSEQSKITDQELNKLAKLLKSKHEDTTLYQAALDMWIRKHKQRNIYDDIVML